MKEWNSFIITFKKTMIASKGMFTCNIAYIPSNWKDIRIGDMSELMGHCAGGFIDDKARI